MTTKFENEPMLEIYIFETSQIIDQLEQLIISSEKSGKFSEDAINEIFRHMHTIKGSSGMMLFNNITLVAHTIEDLFFYIRETKPEKLDYSLLADKVLDGVDFIKVEVAKIKNFDEPDGDASELINALKMMLENVKLNAGSDVEIKKPEAKKQIQYYIPQQKKSSHQAMNCFKAKIFFSQGCGMENVRAYTVIFALSDYAKEVHYFPSDISENDSATLWIQERGFDVYLKTAETYEVIEKHLKNTIYLESLELVEIVEEDFEQAREMNPMEKAEEAQPEKAEMSKEKIIVEMADQHSGRSNEPVMEVSARESIQTTAQTMISVHVDKLDVLMNMVGELVIAEAMVTQNPMSELVESETYQKAARQLHKITGELQDMVMAIRMVPLSTTFVKMNRIVRDMCKKLSKDVVLELYGEETEVDKNIIEHISDPLMHLIRNALDHGIEDEKERLAKGKDRVGKIILEAKNAGSDVLIIIKDDGKGLSRDKILEKARDHGLIHSSGSDLSDREIFNLIMLPGFSTKDVVTEFSGRGVGMDVVAKNLESVGGTVVVDSIEGKGTTITLKIPLTLAIIEGMNIRVGESRFTVPITTIKESFRPELRDCVMDPDNNEMIMVRGQCYPILRLHEHYKVRKSITELTEGILLMVEQDEKVICLFADELLGQQQVVVKSMPQYIKNIKKILGIAGCTLLGDGNISLILDIAGLAGLRTR